MMEDYVRNQRLWKAKWDTPDEEVWTCPYCGEDCLSDYVGDTCPACGQAVEEEDS